MMPFNDVAVETRPLIDTEHTVNATDNTANGAADDSADWACRTFAFTGSLLNTSGDTLGNSGGGNK
jgi:hypothetical protein